jgi:hypothetical protein
MPAIPTRPAVAPPSPPALPSPDAAARRSRSRRRRRRDRENPDFIKAADRFLRALARRAVEHQDLDALAALQAFKEHRLEELMADAVKGLRSEAGGAYSWTEVGLALGYKPETAKQAAAQRFPNSGGARRPGAQPYNRR